MFQNTDKTCNFCQAATHKCRMCNLPRCKQHHLNTDNDGESFVCSVCDASVVGILGRSNDQVPGSMAKADKQRVQDTRQKLESERKEQVKNYQEREKEENLVLVKKAETEKRKKEMLKEGEDKRNRDLEEKRAAERRKVEDEKNCAAAQQRKRQRTAKECTAVEKVDSNAGKTSYSSKI